MNQPFASLPDSLVVPHRVPLSAADIQQLHDTLLNAPGWPQQQPAAAPAELLQWLQRNHRCNSLLWAEEDLARRTTVADAEIAANKRAIDGHNQARNDATERIDEILLLALGLVDPESARSDTPSSRASVTARLNSETAGSMIDRLSILALKVHAMRLQTLRSDVDEPHRRSSATKLARLLQQREDLGGCLDALLADAATGKALFKIYRQFKMYNDAALNPELVKEKLRLDTGAATSPPLQSSAATSPPLQSSAAASPPAR